VSKIVKWLLISVTTIIICTNCWTMKSKYQFLRVQCLVSRIWWNLRNWQKEKPKTRRRSLSLKNMKLLMSSTKMHIWISAKRIRTVYYSRTKTRTKKKMMMTMVWIECIGLIRVLFNRNTRNTKSWLKIYRSIVYYFWKMINWMGRWKWCSK